MGQKVEFLFKVCCTDENPDDLPLARIAVPDDTRRRGPHDYAPIGYIPPPVLYQYRALNEMGELVWIDREPGTPATFLRHVASIIEAFAIGTLHGSDKQPKVTFRTDGGLSIDLGTLFIDRPVAP